MQNITVDRLNQLQSRIAAISGPTGYGQTLVSSQITADTITAADFNNIYTDIIRARIHQIGPHDQEINAVAQNYNVVAEDTSFAVTNDGVIQLDDGDTQGVADFERVMTQVETDRLSLHSSQAELITGVESVRENRWNKYLFHEVVVTFTDEQHLQNYFNAGGDIRFAGKLETPRGAKSYDWKELLDEIGVIQFKATETQSQGYGTFSNVGGLNVTAGSSLIFQRIGSSDPGVYAGNRLSLNATKIADNQIKFRIEYHDAASDGRIDNNVVGTITSSVDFYTADGDNVAVPAPSVETTIRLTDFATPPRDGTVVPEDDPFFTPDQTDWVNSAYSDFGVVNQNEIYRINVAGRPRAHFNITIESPQNPTFDQDEDHLIENWGGTTLIFRQALPGTYYHTLTFSNDEPHTIFIAVKVKSYG